MVSILYYIIGIQINTRLIKSDEEKDKVEEFLKKFSSWITLTMSLDNFFIQSFKEIIGHIQTLKENTVPTFKQYAQKVRANNITSKDSYAYFTVPHKNLKKFISDCKIPTLWSKKLIDNMISYLQSKNLIHK